MVSLVFSVKKENAIVLRGHPLEIEVCESCELSGFRLHSQTVVVLHGRLRMAWGRPWMAQGRPRTAEVPKKVVYGWLFLVGFGWPTFPKRVVYGWPGFPF